VPGEESRWTLQSKEFDSQIQRLTGDCAVASAFVSYLGPFNKEFRQLLMTRDFYGDCIKLNIPVTQNIEVRLGRVTVCAVAAACGADVAAANASVQHTTVTQCTRASAS
jgi:dynein heavy chain